jgi:transposase-like protein
MITKERREKMLQLVEQWQQSGQSQKAFAKAHDIKLFTFRYWVQKHREKSATAGAFVQLGTQQTTGISIRYPNGTELQLPAATPLPVLKVLLSL